MWNSTRTFLRNYPKSWRKDPNKIRLGRAKSSKKLIAVSVTAGSALLGTTVFAINQSGKVLDHNKQNPLGDIYDFQTDTIVDHQEQVDNDTLPLVYNAKRIEKYWKDRPLEVLLRTGEIIGVLGPYIWKLLVWEYFIRQKIRDNEGLQKKYAIKLRECLTDLGPCFIKLGQALSIRPDLLPSTFVYELQKLCDSVPSFPTSDAIAVIESELGVGAASRLFEDLNPNTLPIASASLGQVYKLKLRSESQNVNQTSDPSWCRCKKHCQVIDEKIVAVKVQRPDMAMYVLRDLYIIRQWSKFVEWFKVKFTYQTRPYDVDLVDTFGGASLKELDYINEAQNQENFRRDLMHRMGSKIYIPAVHEKMTTRKVLVSEWIEGIQLAKSDKATIQKLTPVGVECFLTQLLETGQFHSDPHPGNLLVTEKDQRLALIDFGLCAEVPLPDTKNMTLAIVHLMQGDVPGLLNDSIELGFLPHDVDKTKLLPALQKVFDDAQLAMKEEFQNQFKYKAVQSRRKRFMAVSTDLNIIFYTYPFLVPAYFALITRAMIVLEGIALTGDPDFDLFQSAYPYASRRAVSLFGLSNLSEIAMEAAKNYEFLKLDIPH